MENSGRNKFKKYKYIISILIKLNAILPNSINKLLLNTFRNISGKKGLLIRYILFKNLSKTCGDNISIAEGVFLFNINKMSFGSNISIHPMCYIDALGELIIGNDVSIAHNTSILTTNHTWHDNSRPIKYNKVTKEKVFIEDNVWIGAGCRILSGVNIQSRSVIAAGAVVTNDVKANTIVGGIPAKVIKSI